MSEGRERDKVRLAIAGGGTGGHVTPALAVVEELRRRERVADILWLGSVGGVEREAAAKALIPFQSIQTGKLRRYASVETVADAARLPIGIAQARRALTKFRPDVLLSTGGFVSVPSVVAAKGLAPILTHEQTAILGLATRIDARFADVLALSWEATAAEARRLHRCVVVTGNPVRAGLTAGDAARGRAHFDFRPDLPILYVTGGARGASPLNRRLLALLPELLKSCQIVHQTGPASANADLGELLRLRETWPRSLSARYQALAFVGDELPDLYAACHLVVSRAGAGTVAELAAVGKPAIFVPLPGAGGDEQSRNARLLADAGAAVIIPQSEATPDRLRTLIVGLLDDPASLANMGQRARSVATPGAAGRLADALLELAAGRADRRPG